MKNNTPKIMMGCALPVETVYQHDQYNHKTTKQLMKKNIFRSSLPAGLAFSSLVFLVCAGSANADTLNPITTVSGITGNVQIGGEAESGAIYANFDSQTPASTSPFATGGMSVSFVGNAGTGPGAINGGAAPLLPWMSGNNNVNFESPSTLPSGGEADPTTFVSTGDNGANPPGMITFSFGSTQNYFGLLWGSIDFGAGVFGTPNNLLKFYSGPNGTGTIVAMIDGNDIANTDPNIDVGLTSNGSPTITGTAYVNLNVAGGFQSVVSSSGNFTFEIDNVAYGLNPVPEPTSVCILLLAGLSSLVLIGKNWRKQSAIVRS